MERKVELEVEDKNISTTSTKTPAFAGAILTSRDLV